MKIQEIEFYLGTMRKNPQLGTAKPIVIPILRFNSISSFALHLARTLLIILDKRWICHGDVKAVG